MSLVAVLSILAWTALVALLLWCAISAGREHDPDRNDTTTGHSVEYWAAQVDSWLAQLAEIRNLVELPDHQVPPGIAPDPVKVCAAQANHPTRTPPSRARNDHHRDLPLAPFGQARRR